MRIKPIYSVSAALLILVLAGAVSSAYGQPVFRIETDKDEYMLGEPVYLLLTLKNDGGAPIRYLDLISAEVDTVKIRIKRGNTTFDYVPPLRYDFEREPATLQPGEAFYSFTRMFLSNKGPTFDKAGEYKITARFDAVMDGGALTSNTIRITVSEPQSDREKQAYSLISGGQQALFLYFQGGDHLKDGLSALHTLMNKYPDSVYADHARIAVGVSLSIPFRNRRRLGPLRAANPEKAADLLLDTSDSALSAPQIARKYVTLIKVYNDIGANADAANTEAQFRSKFKGTFAEKLFDSMSSIN